MGTWDLKNFENDEASDFVLYVMDSGKSMIGEAIGKIAGLLSSHPLDHPLTFNL